MCFTWSLTDAILFALPQALSTDFAYAAVQLRHNLVSAFDACCFLKTPTNSRPTGASQVTQS
jgi:hypothetical protein